MLILTKMRFMRVSKLMINVDATCDSDHDNEDDDNDDGDGGI